jgi:hypothetical protein
MSIDITSHFHGYDVDQFELIDRIVRFGWQVEKIDSKQEGYVVDLKNKKGMKLQYKGNTVETALAHALIYLTKQHQMTHRAARQETWVHLLPQIAQAYAQAPVFDYKAAPSWKALADDDAARANMIKKVLDVETTHEPVPYPDGYDMAKDIQKGKIKVSLADLKHPIWTPMQHMDHRLVHAVLGVAPSGGVANWVGVNQAASHHMPYLSDLAKHALFTEHIGHKAYQTHYSSIGPKKICHLKEFLQGNTDDLSDGEPVEETRVPWLPKKSSLNEAWESGIVPEWPNAYITHDPLGYFQLKEEAKALYRPWDTWDKIVEDQ